MGRDSHPRDRQRAKLERKEGRKVPGRRFLIVCEGEKTEPHYLEELRTALRLPTANLHILHEGVTQPRQIVEAARDVFLEGKGDLRRKAADVLVAVFDRDDHRTYHEALALARQLDEQGMKNDEKKPVRVFAVPSNSCFELWLLLHWKDVQNPVHRHDAFDQVRQNLTGYDKGTKGVFARTAGLLPEAARRAFRLEARGNPMDGPWSSLPALLQHLLEPGLDLPALGDELRGNPEGLAVLETRLAELFPKAGSSRSYGS